MLNDPSMLKKRCLRFGLQVALLVIFDGDSVSFAPFILVLRSIKNVAQQIIPDQKYDLIVDGV